MGFSNLRMNVKYIQKIVFSISKNDQKIVVGHKRNNIVKIDTTQYNFVTSKNTIILF